jgi:hypothetical protein
METTTEIERFKAYLQSKLAPDWHVVTSTLENLSSNPLTLIVEPFATDIAIPPDGKCEIIAEQPIGYAINLTFSDKYVQMWAGGTVEVYQNGVAHGTTSEYVEWRKGLHR